MTFNDKSPEEVIKYYEEHTIEMDDTFKFGCNICGACCRNRHEPIILTGYDLHRISKHLNKPAHEVADKYCKFHIGGSTHLPVLTIREREYDGSCSFLRKGRCELHLSKSKPVVCGLYPLGRFYSSDRKDVRYILQDNLCGNGSETHVVRDWLNDFGIDELDDCSTLWQEIILSAGEVTCNISDEEQKALVANVLAVYMYLNFNPDEDYVPQAEQNYEKIKEVLEVWQRVAGKATGGTIGEGTAYA